MEENDEARVAENIDAKESDIKIGLTVQQSFVLSKSNLIQRAVIFGITIYMIYKHMQAQDADDLIGNFLVKNIWIPLFFVNLVMTLCLLYFMFAMTQTSLRFLYIDVYYVNVFAQLVRIFFSVYMLVIIFIQHTYFISDRHMLVSFDRSYIIIAALIFSYILIDSLLVIAFVACIYFRMDTVKKFLSKYWFVRLIIYFFIDIFLVGYYLFLLISEDFDVFHALFFGVCLLGALTIAYCIKIEMFQPKLWKLKELDENRIPQSEKITLAVKIMEMKKDVKIVAQTA
eukprot:TRINITY_DN2776_c0_g1_i1.p1 TRINITY_DN2776_c0_g1~~TRINITY_DN2776_c0_g1_i1.p1  ORF type:complete len:314 (-),score=49.29 TRINITY_DN2776_c0_g1_i1:50-904(-)